jgi:hypothetical protein
MWRSKRYCNSPEEGCDLLVVSESMHSVLIKAISQSVTTKLTKWGESIPKHWGWLHGFDWKNDDDARKLCKSRPDLLARTKR